MTHEQYLAIYERERKKSDVSIAAQTIFKALHREIAYRVSQKRENLQLLLKWANAVWQYISDNHSELKADGFKNMTNLVAEKSGDSALITQMKMAMDSIE